MTAQRAVFTHSDLAGRYKPMGRTDMTDRGLRMGWSASGLSFGCRATKLVFRFGPYVGGKPAAVRLSVDDYSLKYVLDGAAPVIILDGLPDVPHVVTLLRISEGEGQLFLTHLELWGDESNLLLPPAPAPRKMLFIGDSLTCGYGTDSVFGETVFSTWEEDATHAHAYLTASALGADYQIVSISGRGIYCSCNGETRWRFRDFWNKAAAWSDEVYDMRSFVPDVVCINGGTNDKWGGATPENFIPAARALLADIRATYPAARIVWYYGMCTPALSEEMRRAIADLRDPGMVFVPATGRVEGEDPTRLGCHNHPNFLAQTEAAAGLIQCLKERMGYQ